VNFWSDSLERWTRGFGLIVLSGGVLLSRIISFPRDEFWQHPISNLYKNENVSLTELVQALGFLLCFVIFQRKLLDLVEYFKGNYRVVWIS
jgi:hypothetical protein